MQNELKLSPSISWIQPQEIKVCRRVSLSIYQTFIMISYKYYNSTTNKVKLRLAILNGINSLLSMQISCLFPSNDMTYSKPWNEISIKWMKLTKWGIKHTHIEIKKKKALWSNIKKLNLKNTRKINLLMDVESKFIDFAIKKFRTFFDRTLSN